MPAMCLIGQYFIKVLTTTETKQLFCSAFIQKKNRESVIRIFYAGYTGLYKAFPAHCRLYTHIYNIYIKQPGLLPAVVTIIQQLKIDKCNYNNVSMTIMNVNNTRVTNINVQSLSYTPFPLVGQGH